MMRHCSLTPTAEMHSMIDTHSRSSGDLIQSFFFFELATSWEFVHTPRATPVSSMFYISSLCIPSSILTRSYSSRKAQIVS